MPTTIEVLQGLMIAAVFWVGFTLGARAERRNVAMHWQRQADQYSENYHP